MILASKFWDLTKSINVSYSDKEDVTNKNFPFFDRCGNADEMIFWGISRPPFPPSVATSRISSVAK